MKLLPVVLLIAAGVALVLHAQEPAAGPWQNVFWDEDVSLANGRFSGGDRKIEITGKHKVEVRGAVVESAHFENLGGVAWTITDSSLRKTSLWCKLNDTVNATGSIFEDTEVKKFGVAVARNWSSRWVFEDCAFAQKFTPAEVNTRDYSIRAEHCTFHDLKMPEVTLAGDPARELQTVNFSFKNCRFVGCEIPESLLVSTIDCIFERCRFGARSHRWDKNSRQMSVTAYVADGDALPESYGDEHLKVTFKNADLPVAGCMTAYSYTDGHLALGRVPAGESLAIGSIDNKAPKVAKAAPPPPSATPTPIAVETKPAEGTPILDKDHTDGWKYFGKAEMTIRDGTVTTPASDSVQGVFWYTKKTFGNFVLQMEFNVDSMDTNSGVYMRFPDPGTDFRVPDDHGVEIDILGGRTGTVFCHPAKGGRDRFPSKGAALLVGAWNDLEISAEGQKYIVKLNGQVINECTGTGTLGGYIGLQALKGAVSFRNIRVRELAETPTVAANAAGPEGNLLQNASFDKGTENWALNVYGVRPTVTKDDKQTHGGHPSVRIDQPELADAALEQTVSVKADTRYRLSGWIKTENIVKPDGDKQRQGEGGVCLAVSGGYDKTPFLSATKDWTQVSVDFSSGNKTSIKVGPRMGHYGKMITGTAWFAELSLVELDAKPVAGKTAPPLQTPPLAPDAAATQTTTAELVKKYRNSLVFVTGTNGAGSGFLAKYSTGNFLFTNAHVAAGVRGAAFKTLEGGEVKIGAASCAVGHDIFLMQATTNGESFEIMKDVDQNAAIGDDVVVLGNAEGAGVINTLTGKIVGLGPQLVEVNAPFQPGNSGSPIVHLKSGKVIGVATYEVIRKYDPSTKEPVKEPVIRRFGYRLDSVKSWQAVNWQTFFAQATEMEAIEKLTKDLAAFLNELASEKRINLGAHNNPAIKNRIDAWLEARSKKLSPRDAATADQSLMSFLRVACQNDVTAARQHMTYDYFQRDLADQQKERDEIGGVFNEIIQNLRKEK
ncbi:MAG TPA: family 16 glycoside hydrolase [Chthoniobacter sp.]|nr:family 16 glycoside hydrolase [Chthoniobacter sp.]